MHRRPHAVRLAERGAAAGEYALLVTGIAVAVVAAVIGFGDGVRALFDAAVDALDR